VLSGRVQLAPARREPGYFPPLYARTSDLQTEEEH
jgi:hypothetical protein